MRRAVFFVILAIALSVKAREVDSKEDIERLSGFAQHQADQKKFEKERLSDLHQVRASEKAWGHQRDETLIEYQREKKKQQATLADTSHEYREDLREKLQFIDQEIKSRREYVQKRDQVRHEEKTEIHLTEAQELGLDPSPDRVDWKRRHFFAETGKALGGKAGGGASPSTENFSGGAGRPSGVPPPPPPEFYESEPPPPVPPIYDPGMPQGGGFDDPMPPPIFDDPEF